MTESRKPADAAERERALDPGGSFLVQAPAGAGKTELLTRRFLRLLAVAEEPEEILAVTFTRKAAAEMRRRVFEALTGAPAAGAEAGTGNADAQRASLVAAVRARDAARGWQLARHPSRLRISTIDSLNAALARGTPVSSGSNALREQSLVPRALYHEAARSTLRLLADDGPVGPAVADLLRHVDVDPGRLELLLVDLLARRDQWLPWLAGSPPPDEVRLQLEAGLCNLVNRELRETADLLSPSTRQELAEIHEASLRNRGLPPLEEPHGEADAGVRLAWWQSALGLLLTKEGDWRKPRGLNRTVGFPPDQPALKERAAALMEELRQVPRLLEALAHLRHLPPPVYPEYQWQALAALMTVLPRAAAELILVFADRGQTDYIQVATEALAALGDEDVPSELALRLDWRLRHILVDEFQDTSRAQYALLTALTRGWTPGDGRTVFLVGDPMQSVYRFRQAEVRLFLESRHSGLPGIPLQFLRLRSNFRSEPSLVAWVNERFPRIFPGEDDLLSGAVAFAPGAAERTGEGSDGPAVTLEATPWNAPEREAEQVVERVREALRNWPDQNIGILVRNRSHATPVVAALRQAGIPFGASELVLLGRTALAGDLLAITRAVLHPGDRLAWLALLRAPWCGLTLADLASLGRADPHLTLLEHARRIVGETTVPAGDPVPALSPDGCRRLIRVMAAVERALGRLGAIPLRAVVEGLWHELGGPATAGDDLPLADLVLAQIARFETGGTCPDVEALARDLDEQPASLADAREPVQVMTIHKAKGLEFDTVIVPALGRPPRKDDRPMLLWDQPGLKAGEDEDRIGVLLAPVNASGAATDALYELLWRLRLTQGRAEDDRLLYVAVTRAKRRLHLLGQTRSRRDAATGEILSAPVARSLLAGLWPALAAEWPAEAGPPALPVADDRFPDADPTRGWFQPVLRRLPADWQRPPPPPGLSLTAAETAPPALPPAYDWAGAWSRQAGSVAHRWLQFIASRGVEAFDPSAIRALEPRCRQLLLRAGVEDEFLGRATERVLEVLRRAVGDGQGRWILSGQHAGAVNEYPLTAILDGRTRHLVLDRSFVTPDGVRWIVDYKTGSHEGGDREGFIASEVERYREQLRAYRRAFAALDSRPMETALYFPLLGLLQSVPAGPASE